MNIYLIRHGRQNSKLCNVDVELSKEGREQADLCGRRLKSFGIEAVYSSDLKRAVETADIINTHLGMPRFIDPRVRESNFGDMTGLTNDELKTKYKDFLNHRKQMIDDIPYPGGGENCEIVSKRMMEAIEDISKKDYENVCIVTHGGAIRALLTAICKMPYARWLVFGRNMENCSISQILYDKDQGTYHIERLNDFAHLDGHDELLRKHFTQGFFSPDNK